MKLIKKYDQNRRDCYIDIKCEGCGDEQIDVKAYDDYYFWMEVLPKIIKCEKCGKTTESLGKEKQCIVTKYPEGMRI